MPSKQRLVGLRPFSTLVDQECKRLVQQHKNMGRQPTRRLHENRYWHGEMINQLRCTSALSASTSKPTTLSLRQSAVRMLPLS